MAGTPTDSKTRLGDFFKSKPAATGVAAPKAPTQTNNTAPAETEAFFVPAHEIEGEEWDLGRYLVRIVEATHYTKKGESVSASIRVKYLGLCGQMKGSYYTDFLPKKDTGLRKTKKMCKAVGLVDENGNISMPGGVAQLIDRELWIEITEQTEKRRDQETGDETSVKVNKIGFTSYWPKDEFPLPVEGDLFADGAAEAAIPSGGSTDTVMFKTQESTVEVAPETGEVVGVETEAPAF